MANKIIVNKEKVTTLFNKIRTKAGVTGSKTFDEMNDVVDSIQTGGGSTGDGEYRVRYLDIDGTVLKEEYLNEGNSLTPPDNPSYDTDYLVFDTWNYDIENVVVDRDYDIGAIYNTIDNSTYMFCRFTTNTGLNPTLAINGSPTIDWGDGTVDTSKSHTYASEGEYVIKISGSFSFSTSSSVTLFGSQTKCKVLKKIYLSKTIITVNDYLVSFCNSLEIISLPNTINKFGERAFNSCYNLKNIIIPKNVTTIGNYCFYSAKSLQRISFPNSVEKTGRYSFNYCYLLNSICIPNNLTYIDQATFQNCYSLKSISVSNNKLIDELGSSIFQACYNLKNAFLSNYNAIIPYGMYGYCHNIKDISIPEIVTSIEGSAFRGCFLLKNIKIPKNVTSIRSQAFYECFRVINYFILCETVPTLSGTDAFQDINNSCTMWVNDEIYKELRTATNWSTYASYMKKLSDCPQDLLDENGIERPEPAPEPSGFNVELLNVGIMPVSIYEGTSTSGKYLGNYEAGSTIITSSEYLHLVPNDYAAYNDYINVTGGVLVYADGGAEYLTLRITGDGTLSCYFSCLIEDTPITLADGQYKMIQDITYEDELLVWDLDKGKFASAKPLWIMKERKAIEYNHLVFSDGSELNTVNQHRIFNIEKGMFTYPMTDDTPIGTTTFNDKGEYVTLVSKEVVEKEVNYYNIITDYHINLFAGSILTSCRLSNIYPIEDMKYVKDNRGIIDYEEFNNIPIEYYYGLRLGEQPVDINRDGAVSFGDTSVEDYVKRLISMKKE